MNEILSLTSSFLHQLTSFGAGSDFTAEKRSGCQHVARIWFRRTHRSLKLKLLPATFERSYSFRFFALLGSLLQSECRVQLRMGLHTFLAVCTTRAVNLCCVCPFLPKTIPLEILSRLFADGKLFICGNQKCRLSS